MKKITILILSVSAASCGGGGNFGQTELRVIPDQAEVSGPIGQCASGQINTFYIYGGTPPYKVSSTVPQGLSVSTDKVEADGGSFTANVNGQCLDKVQIVIQDDERKIITAAVTNKVGQ